MTTDPLTPERFRALADAYGGAVARWPEADREAGLRFARCAEGARILARAEALDGMLDAWRVAAPAPELTRRVIAAAPATARQVLRRARLWWSGIGVAVAVAGAAAGVAGVLILAPVDGGAAASTSFGDVVAVQG